MLRVAKYKYFLYLPLLICIQLFARSQQDRPATAAATDSLKPPPTVITKIIDPDNGPGTDYTSLEAFATLEKRDLVAANEMAVALCRSSKGSPDKPAQFDGWVTDARCFVIVRADSGHRASASWDDSKYRILETSTGNTECIDVEIDYMRIDGIQMRMMGEGTNNDVVDVQGNCKRLEIANCYIWLDIQIPSGTGVDPKGHLEMSNCIVRSSGGGGQAIRLKVSKGSSPSGNIYNCTFAGGWQTIVQSEGPCRVVNNLVRGCQTQQVFRARDGGSFTGDSDFNSSNHPGASLVKSPRDAGQRPWFNGDIEDETIFVDAAGGDYRLRSDAILCDTGIGPSQDSRVPHADIDGNTRSGKKTSPGAHQPSKQ